MGWKISIDKIRDLNYNINIMNDKKLKVNLDNCCYNRPFDTVRNILLKYKLIGEIL